MTHIPNCEEFLNECKKFEKHEKRDAMYKVTTFLVDHFWGKPSDMKPPNIADGLGVLLLTWNQAFYRYGVFDFNKLEKCIIENFQKIKSFRNRDISSLSNSDEGDIMDLFNKFLDALQIDTMKFSDMNKKRHTKKQLEELLRGWDINYDNSNLEVICESIKDNSKIKDKDAVEFIKADKTGSKKEYIQITISKLGEVERNGIPTKLIMKSPVAVAKALHLLASKFFPLWDEKIAQNQDYKCYYNKNPADKYVSFCKITRDIAEKVSNYPDVSVYLSDRNRSYKTTLIKLIDEYNYSKYTKGWS